MEKFGLMAKERIHSSDTGRNWEDRVRMWLVIRNRAPRDSYTGLTGRASLSSEPAQPWWVQWISSSSCNSTKLYDSEDESLEFSVLPGS